MLLNPLTAKLQEFRALPQIILRTRDPEKLDSGIALG